MEFRTFVSVVDYEGNNVADLTSSVVEGGWSRKLSATSEGAVVVGDMDHPVFRRADFMTHSLRFEVEYSDKSREIVWEGPLIVWPKRKGRNVLASDQSVFWLSSVVADVELPVEDSSFMAERMLSSSLIQNPLALPGHVEVLPSGYSSDIVLEEGAMLMDSLSSLVGLAYCFVGKNLFLFSVDGLDVDGGGSLGEVLRFDDASWLEPPVVEQIFKFYANSVVVVGGDSVGVAEGRDSLDFKVSRRFDFPDIFGRDQVQAKAEELLLSTSRLLYVDVDNVSSLNFGSLPWKLSDLIPGRKAVVVLEDGGNIVSEDFLVDTVEVDIVSGKVSVGFIPLLRGGVGG